MEKNTALSRNELKQLSKNDLERKVLELQESVSLQEELLSQKEELLTEKNARIDFLTEQLRLAQHRQFGRKTEQTPEEAMAKGQLVFEFVFNEAEATKEQADKESKEEETSDETSEESVEVKAHKRKKTAGKRAADLSRMEIRVEDIRLDEEELNRQFPNGYTELPPEITHTIEHEPAKYYAIEYRIHKYKAKENSSRIASAARPLKLFPTSLASPTLVAGIMNAKYVNAMPLYRIEQEFERNDVPISRQDMAHWMILSSERYLSLVYDRMKDALLTHHVLHADETPTLVTKDGRKAGAKSFMWVYRSNFYDSDPVIIYEYQKSRHGSHPKEFLKDFKGILVTDGFEVYHNLERSRNGEIQVAGCWVHMERKFKDALKGMGKSGGGTQAGLLANQAVAKIGQIFSVNKELKDLSADERLRRRQEQLAPIVDEFFAWLREHRQDVTVKSLTGKAIQYALNQESYLRVFLTDGEVPMDNNPAERSIRPFCLGKKNWIMHDTVYGAESSAMIYSIVETAKANNLKPYEYLKHLLTEIPKHMEDTDLMFLEDLLPWSETLPTECRKKEPAEDEESDA